MLAGVGVEGDADVGLVGVGGDGGRDDGFGRGGVWLRGQVGDEAQGDVGDGVDLEAAKNQGTQKSGPVGWWVKAPPIRAAVAVLGADHDAWERLAVGVDDGA